MKPNKRLYILLSSALVISCAPHNLSPRDPHPQDEEPPIEVIQPLPYGTDILIEPEVITGDLEAKVDSVLSAEIERFYLIAARDINRKTRKYEPLINNAHQAYPNVPIDLIKAVMYAESKCNPRARSPRGAVGLMQLMPGTAADMGVPSGKREDPYHSIMGGTRYLSELMKKYGEQKILVIIAYNQGPARIDRYLERKNLPPNQVRWNSIEGLIKPEAKRYVARVRAGKSAIAETS